MKPQNRAYFLIQMERKLRSVLAKARPQGRQDILAVHPWHGQVTHHATDFMPVLTEEFHRLDGVLRFEHRESRSPRSASVLRAIGSSSTTRTVDPCRPLLEI